MNRIGICTFARSEYGLLRQVIRSGSKHFNTRLIAGGWHLQHGGADSLQEILDDQLLNPDKIHKVPFVQDPHDTTNPMELLSQGIGAMHRYLSSNPCDLLIVMGDRHELFAATLASLHLKIPVAHISGGEISEGAIDDSIRHATTKLAHLHLTANRDCAQRVSSMGEEDWRIVISGEPGLDNIHSHDMATPDELRQKFGLDITQPMLLVTLHPSTMEPGISLQEQYRPLSNVLRRDAAHRIIITAPAPEEGANEISREWLELEKCVDHVTYIPHLGSRNYLALMQHVAAVVGNSSSGLTEAPSLGIPSVNIGGRQTGRMAANSVIHCGYTAMEIEQALQTALSHDHLFMAKNTVNPYDPYGDGLNSQRVVLAIRKFMTLPFEQRIAKKFDHNTNPSQWNTLLNP
jgi:UDP-hydrolysing UDP-N-acetyl-D-glucosamine 2-epimerase